MVFITLNFISFSRLIAGEPVPGAEIYIELEPDDQPIANVVTDGNGEFMFSLVQIKKVPDIGVIKITITPPRNRKILNESKSPKMGKQILRIPFNKKDGLKFKYVLTWGSDFKAQNRGSFAVSGKSSN